MRRALASALIALGCSSTVSPVAGDDAGVLGADVQRGPDVTSAGDVQPARDAPPARDVPAVPDVFEPPTECALENNGRACAAPGMGCAAAGGGCGATSFRCECGANLRWACEMRTTPACDGGVITPTDAGTCSVVGVWAISFMGETVYFSFDLGTWRAAETLDGLANPIARGSWAMRGDTVELREDGGGMSTSCAPSDLGVYRPVFADSCNTLRLALVSEQCSERGQGLSSWTLTRR